MENLSGDRTQTDTGMPSPVEPVHVPRHVDLAASADCAVAISVPLTCGQHLNGSVFNRAAVVGPDAKRIKMDNHALQAVGPAALDDMSNVIMIADDRWINLYFSMSFSH